MSDHYYCEICGVEKVWVCNCPSTAKKKLDRELIKMQKERDKAMRLCKKWALFIKKIYQNEDWMADIDLAPLAKDINFAITWEERKP